jgi:3-hydroxypropanoate dehydrogenase
MPAFSPAAALIVIEWGLRVPCTPRRARRAKMREARGAACGLASLTSTGEPMTQALNDAALKQLFLDARTFNKFEARAVEDETLRELVELMKWGPTSMNAQPARIVFVKGSEAKEKLASALSAGNVAKTLGAPVTAIVAWDASFHQHLPTQFPANPNAKTMFESNAGLTEATAFRNSSLQAAYLIIAARALGLDCGAMSGFDNAKLDKLFFPDHHWKSNLLINIGYGDASGNHPRGPRLPFDVIARVE